MTKTICVRMALVSAAALMAGAAVSEANAGAFGLREQSTYFQGDAYAGAAAGGDISSMFWNPAATATLEGINSSENFTGIFGTANEHATGGVFVTPGGAVPPGIVVGPISPASSDIGTNALVPASYFTAQLTDRLYAGMAMNAPFGLVTKPDNLSWAGSPIATTSRIFSLEANPTMAYKLTPTLTIGAGVQIEYFEIKLERGPLDAIIPPIGIINSSRAYKAEDVGVGATAGAIWQPMPGTSVGIGYRSAVTVDVGGSYILGPNFLDPTGFRTHADGQLTLPDEVTFSVRQAVNPQLALLGTVQWDKWSNIGNVSAVSPGCVAGGGVCETLTLNYRDGWYFSVGAEYAYSPWLTLRTGAGYEISPITDSTRDIQVPDSNRVHLNFGASYKWSDKITFNAAYEHIFFDDAPFCMAIGNSGTIPATHCDASHPIALLSGSADVSADLISFSVNYRLSAPAPLEPLK